MGRREAPGKKKDKEMEDILERQMQKRGAPFWVLPSSPGLLGVCPSCPDRGVVEGARIWTPEAQWHAGEALTSFLGAKTVLSGSYLAPCTPHGAGPHGSSKRFALVDGMCHQATTRRHFCPICLESASSEEEGRMGRCCPALKGTPQCWMLPRPPSSHRGQSLDPSTTGGKFCLVKCFRQPSLLTKPEPTSQ